VARQRNSGGPQDHAKSFRFAVRLPARRHVFFSTENNFPAPPKKNFSICENVRVFRIVFDLGEIFPQYTLA
jgi:hypothetical protein